MKNLTLTALLGLSLAACAPTQQVAVTKSDPATPTGPGIVRVFDRQPVAETAAPVTQTAATQTNQTTTQTTATGTTTAATQATTPATPAPVTPAQTTAPQTAAPQTTGTQTTPETTAAQTTAAQMPAASAPIATAPATPGGWLTLTPESTERRTRFEAASQVIDPAREYRAVLRTTKGDIVVNLDAKAAPLAVNSFVFLSLNHFYDGTRFHRVIDGFMAQGGDPQSTDETRKDAWGTGGPGYTFVNERSALKFDKAGVLAMANAGPDTNGSQFFITFVPTEFLNGGYTIFGQVAEGMDALNALTRTMTGGNAPIAGAQADVIKTVEIQVR